MQQYERIAEPLASSPLRKWYGKILAKRVYTMAEAVDGLGGELGKRWKH